MAHLLTQWLRVPPMFPNSSKVLLVLLLLAVASVRADHIDDSAYPYAAEITIELLAQEKLYKADPNKPRLFHESTTTRIVLYKFWGSGLLSTQNDPDDPDPHGAPRDVGLMVHEVGVNRRGTSTLKLGSDGGKPVVALEQDTILVYPDGKQSPDVNYTVKVPVQVWQGTLADFDKRERVTAEALPTGTVALEAALNEMLTRMFVDRREEIDANLADNGLKLLGPTVSYKLETKGPRALKVIFDNNLKMARLRLPDMRVHIKARVEQTYQEETSDR